MTEKHLIVIDALGNHGIVVSTDEFYGTGAYEAAFPADPDSMDDPLMFDAGEHLLYEPDEIPALIEGYLGVLYGTG